ncbi:MAG: nuclear transport factor 2 family protein, partial [Candidatus Hermodarchaeota archaeon]
KEYYSWYDPKKVDSNLQWKTEFFYVNVYENNAQAKISIENQNVKYIDYFNLMKIKDTWWIVHKISQPMRKE